MISVQINLPWGRYHAHPWGQNPGRVQEAEWPPSPWRLLRALASAWFRSHMAKIPSAAVVELIELLSKELPEIGIGKVSFAKTVHYQPNYKHSSSDARFATYGRTRHENHFAATAQPFYFRWQSSVLTASQQEILTELLEHVSYFGRADSICEASLLNNSNELPDEIDWCKPCLDAAGKPQKRIAQQCRVVFCANPSDFKITDLWLRRNVQCNGIDTPQHLVNQMLSSDMQVDGGIIVSYQMPDGWPQKWVVHTAQTKKRSNAATATSEGLKVAHYLRFSLQCRVPIVSKFTVPLAEMFRASAIYHLCKVYGDGATSPAIAGKDVPQGYHNAFYLPLGHDMSQPGVITDLHVWCPMGFTKTEMDIFLRVRKLKWGNGRFPVNPVLIAAGDLPAPETKLSIGGGTKLKSRVWQSVTPFVPPLNFYRGTKEKPKFKANALPEKQLFDSLRAAGLHKAVLIERVPLQEGSLQSAWDIVRTPDGDAIEHAAYFNDTISAEVHKNGSDTSSGKRVRRIGFFMRLTFDEPVSLPLPAFGHSSHFGLGLFAPAPEGQSSLGDEV